MHRPQTRPIARGCPSGRPPWPCQPDALRRRPGPVLALPCLCLSSCPSRTPTPSPAQVWRDSECKQGEHSHHPGKGDSSPRSASSSPQSGSSSPQSASSSPRSTPERRLGSGSEPWIRVWIRQSAPTCPTIQTLDPRSSLLDQVDQADPESRAGARACVRARACERMIAILPDPPDPLEERDAPPVTLGWIRVLKLPDPQENA